MIVANRRAGQAEHSRVAATHGKGFLCWKVKGTDGLLREIESCK